MQVRLIIFFFSYFCLPSSLYAQSPSFQLEIDRLKVQLEESHSSREQVDLLNAIAFSYRRIFPDSTMAYAHLALTQAQQIGYEKGIGVALKNTGIGHFKFGSPSDTIIYYYEEAIAHAKKAQDYYTQTACLNNIALVNTSDLYYHQAIKTLFEGIEIFDSVLKEESFLKGLMYGNLGFAHFKIGQKQKSLMYYQEAISLAERIGAPLIKSIYMDEMARTKMAMGRLEEALRDMEEIFPLQESLGDWESYSETLLIYAEIEISQQKYESALRNAKKSYDIAQQQGFPIRAASATLQCGIALGGLRKVQEAIKKCKKAKTLAKEANSYRIQADAFDALRDLYSGQNQYDSAYFYTLKYIMAWEDILKERDEELAAEMEARYQNQKRQEQIRALQSEKEEQRKLLLLSLIASSFFLGLLIWAIRLNWVKIQTAKKLNTQNQVLESVIKDLRAAEEKLNLKNHELNAYISSNMQLENFAYLASHDLKEPITNVMGFSDFLLKNHGPNLDKMGQQCLRYIKDSTVRMENLISDLLTYSVIGKDKKHEPIDLNTLVGEVKLDLSSSISDAGALIQHESLPEIPGNPTEIRMLFQNLLSNALKYSQPNVPPKIHIGVECKIGEYVFSIKDNGIGIAPEFLEKVFVMFKRHNQESKYDGKSTGIGLAICKRVVESHNGNIWVRSQVGQGSTFYFSLPKQVI